MDFLRCAEMWVLWAHESHAETWVSWALESCAETWVSWACESHAETWVSWAHESHAETWVSWAHESHAETWVLLDFERRAETWVSWAHESCAERWVLLGHRPLLSLLSPSPPGFPKPLYEALRMTDLGQTSAPPLNSPRTMGSYLVSGILRFLAVVWGEQYRLPHGMTVRTS